MILLAHKRLVLSAGFDPRGNWVTLITGSKIFLPFALVVKPNKDGNSVMFGVSFMWFLLCALVRRA